MTCVDHPATLHNLPGYTAAELLHQGSQTTVYRATVTDTHTSVVVKVLSQDYPSLRQLVQFRNQYTITKNLKIAGIVRPLQLETCENSYALVMEDVGGVDLRRYAQRHPLCLDDILSIGIQLATILHELHREWVIHKDIKPTNLLIQPESKQIKLIDFSIASLLPKETQALQNPKSLEGTLAYIAPEQTGRMNRAIDYRTDFYALGVTLYELLTGRLPFVSDDPLSLVHAHMTQLPIAVEQVNPAVPVIVGAIALKLMAKNAEDRYQSALGLKHDLEQCLHQWQEKGAIADFALGERDVSDRFLIPEKLYGRETEVQTLLDAFERVSQGTAELMLVAGFSGIGKTAVINEVHKPITRQNSYFIQGKFDQSNRSTPFSAFVQAFRGLMSQLMGESDVELDVWRAKILQAVGEEGQVIIEGIPELAQIIGEQPPLPELSGVAAQNRFNRLFSQFVRIFTTQAHPLVIFLDDLQWADSASLGLLKVLMEPPNVGYLLMLGAYRDNEVFPTHPLVLTLAELQQEGASIGTITLTPLDSEDITRLVADTMLCSEERARALAQLVFQKAQGNPFFTTQFLRGLHDDDCITYAPELGCWQCDIAQTKQLALTNDAVTFMVGRLKKLPEATQAILKLAACMGNRFDLFTLAIICEQSPEDVSTALWRALKEGLVIPEGETYKFFQGHRDRITVAEQVMVNYRFLHDRVQQAAYALIPQAEKSATQYRIGRLLLAQMHDVEDDSLLFDVVGYLNAGQDFLVDASERLQMAELNLATANKALNSTAYAATIDYCQTGIALLGTDGWQTQYDLTLALHKILGSAQLSNADYADLETTTTQALAEITSATDRAEICVLQLMGCCLQGRYAKAIDWGLTGLRDLGVDIQESNVTTQVEQEFRDLAKMMLSRDVYDLLEHNEQVPPPQIQAIIKLLVAIDPPVYITGKNSLYALVGLLGTRYSIEYGNIAESAKSYANYGMLLSSIQSNYQQGYQFADMGVQLAHQFNNKAMQCQAGLMLGSFTHPWARPIIGASKVNNESFLAGMEAGETQYTAYNLLGSVLNLLFQGEELASLATKVIPDYNEVESRIKSERLRIALAGAQIFVQQLVVPNALTHTDSAALIKAAQSVICEGEVSQNELGLAINYSLAMHRCCIIEDFQQGWDFFQKLQPIVSSLVGFATHSYYFFYGSLVLLNIDLEKGSRIDQRRWQWLAENQQQLKIWVDSCPENFRHKYILIEAEFHRFQGHSFEALNLYNQAIYEAQENGFIQDQALIHECVGRFHRQQGKEWFSIPHIQEAYCCYARWGAVVRAAQLKRASSQLLIKANQTLAVENNPDEISSAALASPSHIQNPSTTNHLVNSRLDQLSIFKAAQAITSSVDLNTLLTEVARIILQNSGGDRCALILPNDSGEWQVRAIANLQETELLVKPIDHYSALPVKLIQYVKNTQDVVVINNLDTELPVIDDYLRQRQPKSLLGLPILNQGHLIGILYLKNQIASGVFTQERILILNFLCTQAAISLENARLYRQAQSKSQEIAQQEAEYRSIFENANDGLNIIDLSTDHSVAINSRLEQIHGYTREEWQTLKPNDFIDESCLHEFMDLIETLNRGEEFYTQTLGRHKEGHHFAVEIRAVPFLYKGKPHGLLTVRDISAQKKAEEALRESEQKFRNLISNLNSVVYRCVNDEDWTMEFLSDAIADLSGYPTTDFINNQVRTFASIIHPDDLDITYGIVESVQKYQPYTLEYRIIHRDGSIHWITEKGKGVFDETGKVTHFEGVLVDTSDRKKAEHAICESEVKFRKLLSNLDGVIYRCKNDADWTMEFMGDAMGRLSGYPVSDFIDSYKRTYSSIMHPDDVGWITEVVDQSLGQNQTFVLEYRIIHCDGSVRWVTETGKGISDETGDLSHIEGVILDISDRKQAEAEQQRLLAILENTSDFVGTADPTGKILYLNTTWRQLHQCQEKDLITPMNIAEQHPDWALDIVLNEAIPTAQKSGMWVGETALLDGEHQEIPVSQVVIAHRDSDGELEYFSTILRDISDRKRAEQIVLQKSQDLEKALTDLQNAQLRLVQSEKMSALGGLVAGVAHEINNPLGCIVGNINVTRDYIQDLLGLLDRYAEQFPEPGAEIEEELDIIDLDFVRQDLPKLIRAMKESGDRIRAISTSLRTFSRADTENKQSFNLQEGIESTVLILRHRLKANEKRPAIEVLKNYGDLPEIQCFPGQLNQVFMNLLANAIDMFDEVAQHQSFQDLQASPQTITIQTQHLVQQHQVEIRIIDNGKGMTEAVKSRIFDHLFTTKSVGKGTGLGLAIARQIIVETHGGSLEVQSEVGQGATFCIQLPL